MERYELAKKVDMLLREKSTIDQSINNLNGGYVSREGTPPNAKRVMHRLVSHRIRLAREILNANMALLEMEL